MILITEKKLVQLVCAFIAMAFVLELSLVNIMCSDYYQKARDQSVKTIDISAGRADIVDCNLRNITGTQEQIKALVTAKNTDLQSIFDNVRDQDKAKFFKQIQNVNRMVVDLENPVDTDLVYITSKRYSPTNLAQHLIGYTDFEGKGIAGIEKAFNEKLANNGEKLSLRLNVNGAGEIYGEVDTEVFTRPQVLSLTIDNTVQRMCEAIAKEYIINGSIVVMESKTGKIRAMVSMPEYDANKVADYLESDNSPLLNKALQAYEPGSVIKPLWAATMLEEGARKEEVYYCKGFIDVNGHTYHCAKNIAHGQVDMERALVVSCNCYFVNKYVKNKAFIFKQMANQMDFGSPLSLTENYYTAKGNFPSVEKIRNLGQLSSVSFGQGDFLVTPLHITSYMNMFANDGIYIPPQIAQGVYDGLNNTLIENLYNYNPKRVISSKTAQTIKEMLVKVVEEGAHSRAKPDYLSAAGKTGTAQTGKVKEDGEEVFNAWFCGFYPSEEPMYTICIMMYDGGESTQTTTPIFKKLCDELYYLRYAQVENAKTDTPPKEGQ
ncbi:MAG: penicillin-binding protein 2 [Oscillospiraceae bacterium]